MEHKPAPECNAVSDRRLALVLDQGGSSSRALVFDTCGRVLARAQTAVAIRYPGENQVEQDPLELLESLKRCAAGALAELGTRARDCSVAGLCTQRASALAWRRGSREPLSSVLSWQDRRAAAALEALGSQAARIEQLSGLRLSPHYGASKLRWLVEHESAVADAARAGTLCMGPLAGYLAGSLCASAEELVDAVSASRTQLVDLATRTWSEELCAYFGIRREWLPRMAGSQTDFGGLCIGGRELPLRVVTGDQSAAVFASGEPAPRTLLVNLGTGGFVQALMREPRRADGLLTSLLPAEERGPRFALEGTINGAGAALEWCASRHGVPFEPARLEAALRSVPAPPLFFNAHAGLAAPFWRPQARSRFSDSAGALEELAAVAESILFLVHAIAVRMQAALGPLEHVELSGGLARSDALCQRLADLLEIEVWRREETEASARGLAWLCLGTPMEALASRRFVPGEREALAERQQRWNAWVQALLREAS